MVWNQVGVESSRTRARSRVRPRAEEPSVVEVFDATELAVDAYTYAYPMILMDVMRRLTSSVAEPDRELGSGAPVNEFTHLRRMPDASVELPPHPNPDTLYSSLWFDVSREPLIVNVPESAGRFFSLSLLDHWSDVFAAPGARTTGAIGQTFAIVGPSWCGRLPSGIREYRSPTALGWLVAQTELGGAGDLARVARFQAGLSATPLHAWGQLYTPARPPAHAVTAYRLAAEPSALEPAFEANLEATRVEATAAKANAVELVARMGPDQYFSRFCELTRKNPPHSHDYPLLDRMRRVGIVPGRRFNFAALPDQVRRALERAPLLAVPSFKEAYEHAGHSVNFWRAMPTPRGVYGADYAVRAGVAHAAFGSHANEDATSCRVGRDGNGDPLDSSLRYTLTFSKYALPPARAFWSLALYDARQRLALNPLGRYSIGDRDELLPNRDGSITIHIQRSFPGPEREGNWLPAPRSGGFSLDLRLYWPAPDALNGRWCPPVVRRVE